MAEKRPPIRYGDYIRLYKSTDKGFVKMRTVAVEDGNDWVGASYMAQMEHFVRLQCGQQAEGSRSPLNDMLEMVPEGYEIVQIVEETWKKYAKKEKIPGFVVEKLIVRFQGIFAGVIGVDRFWKVLDIRSKIEEIPAPTGAERERLLDEWEALGIETSGGIEKIVGRAVDPEPEPEPESPREEPEPEPGPDLPPELQGAPQEIVNAYLALPDLAKREFLERIRQMNGNVREAAASYFPEITVPTEAMILVEMEEMIVSERGEIQYGLDSAVPVDVETLLVCEGGRRVPADTGEWGYDDIADFIDGMHPDDREAVEAIIGAAGLEDEDRDALLLLMEDRLTETAEGDE
jgi:hypothetical protein